MTLLPKFLFLWYIQFLLYFRNIYTDYFIFVKFAAFTCSKVDMWPICPAQFWMLDACDHHRMVLTRSFEFTDCWSYNFNKLFEFLTLIEPTIFVREEHDAASELTCSTYVMDFHGHESRRHARIVHRVSGDILALRRLLLLKRIPVSYSNVTYSPCYSLSIRSTNERWTAVLI